MATPDISDFEAEYEATMAKARDRQSEDSFSKKFATAGFNALGFLGSLPKNASIGFNRAAFNSIVAADDMFAAGGQAALDASTGDDDVENPPSEAAPPLQTLFPNAFEEMHAMFDEVDENASVPDSLVQGVSQFALPFGVYMKALGGMQGATAAVKVGKVAAAEAVTAGTAFAPEEARVAGLVAMGKNAENEFGKVLNSVSTDGSLLNNYINWMTDRENEGRWEGRFKNAVDSLLVTAGMAGVLKAVPVAFRGARSATQKLREAQSRSTIKKVNDAVDDAVESNKKVDE